MTTGQRIKAAREKVGVSQAQLAERLGVPYQSISQWERDKRNPKYATLEKIAQALETTVDELMGIGNLSEKRIKKRRQETLKADGYEQEKIKKFIKTSEEIFTKAELPDLDNFDLMYSATKFLAQMGCYAVFIPDDKDNILLHNVRNDTFYILRGPQYLRFLNNLTLIAKITLSQMFEGAVETLNYEDAEKRGYIDILPIRPPRPPQQPPQAATPPEGETTPEDK
ncbi:helix-turn-helix domain-containing protein [Acutalibacter caecimuris]|uniref:helix-turn-helix domain-containing protein n=1 Tax=Acutalibacter caecimuris TaxID=3093657 RepID=UPI002AC9E469|nr:helix-turn-helix transcriptional regulator [Acutalibacter sp. M00118]